MRQIRSSPSRALHLLLHVASARVQRILNAVRDFVGLDQAERKPVNINESLEAALVLLEPEFAGRIGVVRSYGDLPHLMGSPGRLSQVFMNLLLNAIQAIEREGEVRITTAQPGDRLKITVEDSGRGMDQG